MICAVRSAQLAQLSSARQFFFRRELVEYGYLLGRTAAGGNQGDTQPAPSQADKLWESDAYCCLHEQWGSAAWWLECLMYKL